MKFRELPKKWRTVITALGVTTLLSLTALILFVMNTAGSLLRVMIG